MWFRWSKFLWFCSGNLKLTLTLSSLFKMDLGFFWTMEFVLVFWPLSFNFELAKACFFCNEMDIIHQIALS